MNPSNTPWHQIVTVRKDLLSGDLPLHLFAADLQDVALGEGPHVYRDPNEFFQFTYLSAGMRKLASDVVLRLSGKSPKAVRQLSMTYGGGKTHTLIALYHLAQASGELDQNLSTVKELISEAGIQPLPKARVAVLPFDKIDAVKGMEALSPDGSRRQLRFPWSILAWELAGEDGLRILEDASGQERTSAPAEPLLRKLLEFPASQGLGTLVLLDEVLMYANACLGGQGASSENLKNFLQSLTQAAVKTPKCCVVASLLASNSESANDATRAIEREISMVFQREAEQQIQPVTQEEAAEVLKRRLFELESVEKIDRFKASVIACTKGIALLDDATAREGDSALDRYLKHYPFHPDLTRIFYTKWSQIQGFQKTRGVLRTFAMALRDAVAWDQSPMIGPQVFLPTPGKREIPDALRELADIARKDVSEANQSQWSSILEEELDKARSAQVDLLGLRYRELEQAVVATFLHSQPISQFASLRDLSILVGPGAPDKIEWEKGLKSWVATSWFLDDANFSEDSNKLPDRWHLGARPNLRQMHDSAMRERVKDEEVEQRLLTEVNKADFLKSGASGAGAKVHVLPIKPADVEDSGDFRFVILGPKSASSSGNPSAEAKRFLDETTGSDRPRINRNAVVMVAPSRDGLEAARFAVRSNMAWNVVQDMLKDQKLEVTRQSSLAYELNRSKESIREAIKTAWCIVISVSESGDTTAWKLSGIGESLFQAIKSDTQRRCRIQERSIAPDSLLPGGPFDTWGEGQNSKRLVDLVDSFGQNPRLPKMLNRKGVFETVLDGVRTGRFVLRQQRPDRSWRTAWMQELALDQIEKDSGWEIVLPKEAELTEFSPALLEDGRVPTLWENAGFDVAKLYEIFSGHRSIPMLFDGFTEDLFLPTVATSVLDEAIAATVKSGKLWLQSPIASLCHEDIPAGVLNAQCRLVSPPSALSVGEISEEDLPSAWSQGTATGLTLLQALNVKHGKILPWSLVHRVIESAIGLRRVERAVDSGPFPCPMSAAHTLKLQRPTVSGPGSAPEPRPIPVAIRQGISEKDLSIAELQNLAEHAPEIRQLLRAEGVKFSIRLDLADGQTLPDSKRDELNKLLASISKSWSV